MFATIFKRAFLPLFLLIVWSSIFDQFLTRHYEDILGNDQGSSWAFAAIIFFSFLNGILTPLLSWVIFLFATRKALNPAETWSHFIRFYFQPLTIESLRSLGKTFLWSLLLIVPGLIRMVQLSLVPFFVTLHSRYALGEVEALKSSTQAVNKNFFRVAAILGTAYFLWPALGTAFFSEQRDYFSFPLTAVLHSGLDTAIELSALFIMYRIFTQSQKVS